jgi:hypothetical protein
MAQVTDNAHAEMLSGEGANLSWRERLESLKAGMVGAIAAGVLFSLLKLLNTKLLTVYLPATRFQTNHPWGIPLLISLAIAVLAGFLFAVTYRYVIRQDRNMHLGSGAVMAFGLVRGLAQLDVGVQAQLPPLALVLMVVESVALFAGLRLVLDWAIGQRWLQTFSGDDAFGS